MYIFTKFWTAFWIFYPPRRPNLAPGPSPSCFPCFFTPGDLWRARETLVRPRFAWIGPGQSSCVFDILNFGRVIIPNAQDCFCAWPQAAGRRAAARPLAAPPPGRRWAQGIIPTACLYAYIGAPWGGAFQKFQVFSGPLGPNQRYLAPGPARASSPRFSVPARARRAPEAFFKSIQNFG